MEVPAAQTMHAEGFASYTIEPGDNTTTVQINDSNGAVLGTITGGEESKGNTRIVFGTVQLPNRGPLQIRIEGNVMKMFAGEKLAAQYRIEKDKVILEQGKFSDDKLPDITLLSKAVKDPSLTGSLQRFGYIKPKPPQNCPWYVFLGSCVSAPTNVGSAVVCGACVGVAVIHGIPK